MKAYTKCKGNNKIFTKQCHMSSVRPIHWYYFQASIILWAGPSNIGMKQKTFCENKNDKLLSKTRKYCLKQKLS